jgi:hypothetical protein
MHPAAVGAQDGDARILVENHFATLGQTAEFMNDKTADRVVVIILEVGAEGCVEVFDFGGRLDAVAAGVVEHDVAGSLIEVVFVFNVADDLFKHILDGHQARNTAVFIYHDGHVVVAGAKLTQQHIQALGFGNEDGGAQRAA